MTKYAITITLIVLLTASCYQQRENSPEQDTHEEPDAPDTPDVPIPPPACQFDQPFPYSSDSTYLGVHGNRENNNRVFCKGPESVRRGWDALEGRVVLQPISFSADGERIFVTVARTEGCNLYALHRATGETAWCSDMFTVGVALATVITDTDGYLYLTDGYDTGAWVYSLEEHEDHSGVEVRWQTSLDGLYDGPDPATHHTPAGLHFTPDGHIATVTTDGVAVLLDRADGTILDAFDIRGETGFVPPPQAGDPIPIRLIPREIRDRLEEAVGEMTDEQLAQFLAGGSGDSGAFSDNTIAVSSLNQVFVIGGGPPGSGMGSVTALDITETDDDPPLPRMEKRWHLLIMGSSGTSPAISPDGSRMVVGDGGSGESESSLVYVDIESCNANSDGDPDHQQCAPLWLYPMLGKPIIATPGLDENGTVYAWHCSREGGDKDFVAVRDAGGTPEEIWATPFAPDGDADMQWTSSATVMDNMVIGGITNFIEPFSEALQVPIFRDLSHELIAMDRETGRILWRAELDDDSINATAPGPDGALYVPIMGMFDLLAMGDDIDFHGGVIQFLPDL